MGTGRMKESWQKVLIMGLFSLPSPHKLPRNLEVEHCNKGLYHTGFVGSLKSSFQVHCRNENIIGYLNNWKNEMESYENQCSRPTYK